MKRVIYFGYYIKKLNRDLFRKFLNYVSQTANRSKISLLFDILGSSLKYNISILEYFQFHFYRKGEQERRSYAGTGYMYEYQLQMNPITERHILDDKNTFTKVYKDYLVHSSASLTEVESNKDVLRKIMSNPANKVVFKVSDGKCGAEVEIKSVTDFNEDSIIAYMRDNNYDLIEEYIIQHSKIMELAPSAVNTIRFFTQLDGDNNFIILGCRFRISIDSHVDNFAAGNIAAPIDEKTGIVSGPGVFSDITKQEVKIHPITGVSIVGFQIPFWKETVELVKNASLHQPQNRSIGWDVVVTEKGPGLIEGNHDWCKLVWQLPVKKGLKSIIEQYKK